MANALFFSIWLICSRMGDIKLGPDHSEPEYKNLSWFAMLFSAGMGIGLLFFGVAEPLIHLSSPTTGDSLSMQSAREAMKITFFHWGLHAWAMYAVFAVMLAYHSYRKNLPLLPRSLLYPFLGDKIYGPIGQLIDIFCVIGTLFGVATSLGFGVTQVNAGLFYLFQVPQNITVQVLLITVITGIATISVVMGLDNGIKRLSMLNIIVACILLGFVLLLGDTMDLMKSFVQNTGAYLSDLTFKTFNLYAYEKKQDWIGGWTLMYWGWWVSWTPFVGMFIARISRGRTIREFMIGVLLIPSGFTFLWMTVFGNSAINKVLSGEGEGLLEAVNTNIPIAIFKFFELLPMTNVLSMIGLVLIITFFVTSSDSGSLVIDTLASGGSAHPPVWQRIYWAFLEGLVAAVLLIAGGINALQTMAIASAFPMIFFISAAMLAFIKSLKEDYLLIGTIQSNLPHPISTSSSYSWRKRLDQIIAHPNLQQGQSFLENTVKPALDEVGYELQKRDYDIQIKSKTDSVILQINNNGMEDYQYQVWLRPFTNPSHLQEKSKIYYRAEIFIYQGGQHYDVYGYSKDEIILDALSQFEKHLHFLHLANAIKPEDT